MITIPDFDIYPVITEKFCKNGSAVDTLKEVIKGGVKIVQLREKEKSKKEIYELALKFRKITSDAKVILIINDHVDISLAVGADGVHLGQEDIPCEVAKKIATNYSPLIKGDKGGCRGILVGVSTHNLKEALEAQDDGADYINIGPIFATKTKENFYKPLGTKIISELSPKIKIPFTVMGGIKQSNISEVVLAGARRIAMVTEITMAFDIPAKIQRLKELIASALKQRQV